MGIQPNLFIQTAFLGDLCLSVPALKRIKKISPESPLWLVARKGFGRLFQELGVVDRVFEVEKKNPESYRQAQMELRKQSFQWIVCPHESFTSARLVSSLEADLKIGFRKIWNFPIFNQRVEKTKEWPEAFRQLALVAPVDLEIRKKLAQLQSKEWIDDPWELKSPPVWASGEVLGIPDFQNSQFDVKEKWVALFPGSVWATKKWTQVGFITLAKILSEKGFRVVLLGSAQERQICDDIENQVPSVLNLAGKISLLETLGVLKGSQLVVSNDSGGSHLASLTNTKTLTIYGPTVLEQGFRPWVSKGAAVFVESLACRPCGKHGHKKCPIGTHECMKSLTAENIYEVAQTLLQS